MHIKHEFDLVDFRVLFDFPSCYFGRLFSCIEIQENISGHVVICGTTSKTQVVVFGTTTKTYVLVYGTNTKTCLVVYGTNKKSYVLVYGTNTKTSLVVCGTTKKNYFVDAFYVSVFTRVHRQIAHKGCMCYIEISGSHKSSPTNPVCYGADAILFENSNALDKYHSDILRLIHNICHKAHTWRQSL